MGFFPFIRAKKCPMGASIGVVATGAPVRPDRARAGLSELANRGFQVKCPVDPSLYYGKYDYLFSNGSPSERAKTFHELLCDDDVLAIIAARGGYGALDLLPLLDAELIRASRKLLVGCSDVDSLLLYIAMGCGIPSIHGPVISSLFADYSTSPEAKNSVDALVAMISDPGYRLDVKCKAVTPGSTEGRIIAGNLTVFASLLGTPWDVDYSGAILMLEDVGESPYRIHRAMTQLRLAGKFDRLAGLVFGRFAKCTAPHGPTVEEVLSRLVSDNLLPSGCPILTEFPFGHWGEDIPLPLGCVARIDGEQFRTLQSPIEDF